MVKPLSPDSTNGQPHTVSARPAAEVLPASLAIVASGYVRGCRCDEEVAEDPLNASDSYRQQQPMDLPRIEKAVRELLTAIGENPDREGLLETPKRVARAFAELFNGLHRDPGELLTKTFAENCDEIVLERNIPFQSMCEHHLLPFEGVAHIAYLPAGQIVGISKLARALEVFARRPQVQERLTNQLADLIAERLDARGVAVVLDASHSCMTLRGVRKPGTRLTTSALRGVFRTDAAARAEVMALILASATR